MSNKARRKRTVNRRPPKPSCHLTSHEGAKPYCPETLELLGRLMPGVEIVHPLGLAQEFDQDRLVRARGMAGHHKRAFGAVVRVDILTTKYFQQQALGRASSILIMRSKVQHVDAKDECPFGTMVVVFDPRTPKTLEQGKAPIYWESLN